MATYSSSPRRTARRCAGFRGGRQTATRRLVTGYSGAANEVGGQGDVLIPFPGRIGGGRYRFAGHDYQLPRNDHEGPNAIHGFLNRVLWEVESQSDDAVRFATTLRAEEFGAKGYPFSLQAQV